MGPPTMGRGRATGTAGGWHPQGHGACGVQSEPSARLDGQFAALTAEAVELRVLLALTYLHSEDDFQQIGPLLMPTDMLFTVNLPSLTLLPQDTVTNSFVVRDCEDPGDAIFTASINAIVNFYFTDVPATSTSVGKLLSPALSRATDVCTIKAYDITAHLDGSPHGSPVFTGAFTLPAATSPNGLPSEVACVMRLEALGRSSALVEVPDDSDPGLEVNRPKQRHTGRVFVGPLHTTALGGSGGVPKVSATAQNTIVGAGVRLAQTIDASGVLPLLGVWSRKDEVIRRVEYVAVDDAFDTQRRRGERPTALTRTAV